VSGRRRDWGDGRHVDRGARERAADTRRRIDQERRRAALDRASPEADAADADVVVPDGPTLRSAPPVAGIDEVLQSLVEERGWGERLRGADLDQRWDEVVGPALAARSRPGRLAGGVLVVVVESPAWATQLRYLTGQIAGRATAVGGAEVRDVRIVVGELDGGDQ
jgi:predicted nucleic acid-binding Zn ribbon protein